MTATRALPPKTVPTLTEVVELADSVFSHGAAGAFERVASGRDEPGVRAASAGPDADVNADDGAGVNTSVAAYGDVPAGFADACGATHEEAISPPPPITAMDGRSGVHSGLLAAPPPEESAVSEAQIVQRVLQDLQRQIDAMLEYRLREALAPTLAKMAEMLVRDVRGDIAATLRDVVARAVAQELARHRSR